MAYSISSLFGHSPIRPIQRHMKKVQACVGKLADFIEAVERDDWDAAAKVQASIEDLEHDADQMKSDLRTNLPKSLLMPVARSDVLALLSMQDKLANRAKDVAGLMLGRKMKVPEPIADQFKTLLLKSIECSAQALRAIEELDVLFESGFDKRERQKVGAIVEQVDSLENDCDTIQVELRANLLAIEESLSAVNVIFLYRIIENIADISDIAHRVGNRLTILLAR